MAGVSHDLCRLGQLAGIEPGYQDGRGEWHFPSEETYLAILPSLGIPISKPEQARDFRNRIALDRLRQPMPTVQTVWSGQPAKQNCPVIFQVPERLRGPAVVRLILESGTNLEHQFRVEEAAVLDAAWVEGSAVLRRVVQIPEVPWGVHQVRGDFAPDFTGWLIVAPRLAHRGKLAGNRGKWGIFLPVHAMRSDRNQGCGTFSDLGELLEWTAGQGGGLVGTLPMLAGLTENPCEPSPYSPCSRLFWNELFLDLEAIPELANSSRAREWMGSTQWLEEGRRLRLTSLVEHEKVMRHLRPVLEILADEFSLEGPRAGALANYRQRKPRALEYAKFRARHDLSVQSWNLLENSAAIATQERRRLIWQFWAEEQVSAVARRAGATGGPGLYLDLPIGVHSDGFDVYRFGDAFAPKMSAGAPPDSFFTRGQDWGFPPPHPWRQREDGYAYLREVLEHHMRLAGLLRIDHVMGLHRLYWVPWGLGARQGAYVRYPYEELYALYCLNSVRYECSLAGEDLGTVPPAVRPEMLAHQIHRLFVGQFSFRDGNPAMDQPPLDAIASLNTHDLPTFCGFWLGGDIDDRLDLGLIELEEADSDRKDRQKLRCHVLEWLELNPKKESPFDATVPKGPDSDWTLEVDPFAVFIQLVDFLQKSDAAAVLVNVEDLWKALDPQNVPGTWKERPNWQRKARFELADWDRLDGIKTALEFLRKEIQKDLNFK
ncbi:MAG: 4-alpha-glucanotransferase [Gemmataceae bacterium]|nr:4-alpha-glucanotransferase [Gemmataceae bacterium]